MKNTKKTIAKLLAIGLLVGGTGAAAIHQASAEAATDQTAQQQYGHPPQHGPDFMKDVTHSVEKIDNGVVITLTTDDATILQQLQDFAQQEPAHGPMQDLQDVTRTVELLENGAQITLTSTNADTVQKLQEGPRGAPMDLMKNVERTVTNTDTGIVITLSSTDPDTIKMLQDSQGKLPFGPHHDHDQGQQTQDAQPQQ